MSRRGRGGGRGRPGNDQQAHQVPDGAAPAQVPQLPAPAAQVPALAPQVAAPPAAAPQIPAAQVQAPAAPSWAERVRGPAPVAPQAVVAPPQVAPPQVAAPQVAPAPPVAVHQQAAPQPVAQPPERPRFVSPVEQRKVQNIFRDLDKGKNRPAAQRHGSGSTADAVRYELANPGARVGGRTHSIKARQYSTALDNWLARNPDAPDELRQEARARSQDLKDALNGN